MKTANLVMGAIGATFSEVSGILKDNKVTVGEVVTVGFNVAGEIVNLVPGAADKPVYKIGKKTKTVGELIDAIKVTVETGLTEFGVYDIVIGKVK